MIVSRRSAWRSPSVAGRRSGTTWTCGCPWNRARSRPRYWGLVSDNTSRSRSTSSADIVPTPAPISSTRRPTHGVTRSISQRLYRGAAAARRSSVSIPTGSSPSVRGGGIALVTAELAVQRRGIDAQHFGRAALVAPLALQHPRDVGPLDRLERRVGLRALGDQRLGPALGELARHRRKGDDLALGQDHRALHRVFELAHVAGPIVGEDRVHRIRGEPLGRSSLLFAETLEQRLDEDRDVVAPLAQR